MKEDIAQKFIKGNKLRKRKVKWKKRMAKIQGIVKNELKLCAWIKRNPRMIKNDGRFMKYS